MDSEFSLSIIDGLLIKQRLRDRETGQRDRKTGQSDRDRETEKDREAYV